MKLRPIAYVVAGGLLGLIGAGLWKASHAPARLIAVQTTPQPLAVAGTPSPPSRQEAPVSFSTPSPTPMAKPAPRQPEAVQKMENVQFMLRDFRTRMGGNPVGTNAEIMKSVMGDNPFHAKLGPPEGQNLSEEGELLDHWGTPYFFHQQSRDEMEIRSAGPDRKMWTADDVVVK